MTLTDFKPLIAWLHLHPQWSGAIAFLFAFTESIAFVGLIIPGSLIMAAIGILIGSGTLPGLATMAWAMTGAFLGDVMSFGLGYYYHQDLRHLRPLQRFTKWFERGEAFFARHGGKGIFLGRFLGPIRPVLPIIAGMLQMRPARFLAVDAISAIIWAPAYMLPGILIGAASLALDPEMTTHIIIFSLIVLIGVWLAYWFLKKIILGLIYGLERLFYHLWQCTQKYKHLQLISVFLSETHIATDHSQLRLFFYFLLCLSIFIWLTLSVTAHHIDNLINPVAYHFFRSLYLPDVQKWMIAISFCGDKLNLLLLWLVVLGWLYWKRYSYTLIQWFFLGCFSFGITGVLKRLIDYPRPEYLMHPLTSNAYPSEHTALVIVFFGFLALMLTYGASQRKCKLAYICASIPMGLIAFARLYIGIHWLTDIIGAIFLGLTILLGFSISYRRRPPAAIAHKPLLLISLICLLCSWGLLMYFNFSEKVNAFVPRWPMYAVNLNTWWQQGIKDQPIYRTNRLGKVVQTMNVEWIGSLKSIQQHLHQQGFRAKPKLPLMAHLSYIAAQDKSKLFPIIPHTYEDQTPVLSMAKEITANRPLLIVRLWNSHYYVSTHAQTIWIGTIGYLRHRHHHFLLHLHQKPVSIVQTRHALDAFTPYLTAFRWNILSFPQKKRLNDQEDLDWNGKILLVRPKA